MSIQETHPEADFPPTDRSTALALSHLIIALALHIARTEGLPAAVRFLDDFQLLCRSDPLLGSSQEVKKAQREAHWTDPVVARARVAIQLSQK